MVLSLSASSVAAADVSVSAGASVTASRDTTPVVFLDVIGERHQTGAFTWRPVASAGWIAARDVRADLDHDVFIGGIGFRLVDWWKKFYFGVQLGYAAQTTAAVSSHGQFMTSFGREGEHTVLALRHISNADVFGGKNLGETMVLIGYRF